jgi:hypothetical protein
MDEDRKAGKLAKGGQPHQRKSTALSKSSVAKTLKQQGIDHNLADRARTAALDEARSAQPRPARPLIGRPTRCPTPRNRTPHQRASQGLCGRVARPRKGRSEHGLTGLRWRAGNGAPIGTEAGGFIGASAAQVRSLHSRRGIPGAAGRWRVPARRQIDTGNTTPEQMRLADDARCIANLGGPLIIVGRDHVRQWKSKGEKPSVVVTMTATDEAAPVAAGRSSTATATFRLANKRSYVDVARRSSLKKSERRCCKCSTRALRREGAAHPFARASC